MQATDEEHRTQVRAALDKSFEPNDIVRRDPADGIETLDAMRRRVAWEHAQLQEIVLDVDAVGTIVGAARRLPRASLDE